MREQRLIDAEHIVEVAQHAYNEWNLAMAAAEGNRQINRVYKMQELCKAVKAVADSAPTIDPEALPIVKELQSKLAECEPVRHSYWEHNEEQCASRCHDCGACYNGLLHENYCPVCGAKMDEETHDPLHETKSENA